MFIVKTTRGLPSSVRSGIELSTGTFHPYGVGNVATSILYTFHPYGVSNVANSILYTFHPYGVGNVVGGTA